MKNKWKKGILFSFLSLSIITSPLQVFAAGETPDKIGHDCSRFKGI